MGKKNQRKEALLRARRKFLKISAGAAGAAALASCGGQFVKPSSSSLSSLEIKLRHIDQNLINLMAALYNEPELRKEYALKPLHVFREYGLADGIELSKAERLLAYVYNNDQLALKMLKPLEESGYLNNIKYKAKDLGSFQNSISNVVTKLVAEETILQEQLFILLADPGVQTILGIQAGESNLKRLAAKVTQQVKEMGSDPEPTSCTLAIVCVGVAAFVLVKAVVVGQVVVAANVAVAVNVYHTHNYNTTSNGVGTGPTELNPRQMLAIHEWDILAKAVGEFAQQAG